ncbi:SDR family NAD(P)-dependent oxidoreductase [Undibacterium sp. SXout11W]|uniref:SDR family NAD(P)-dependent oxidoreductase n=1 Tax=Undibacterium sp. SXout11W TaxID=3413050 RepID=UPI003BF1652D
MLFHNECLQGRRILVTGASSGIGRTTAELLSQCGARIVAVGRDQVRLKQTLASLRGDGHRVEALDLTGDDNIGEFLQSVTSDNDPLHGIFHAAGISQVRPVKLSKSKQFDEVFASSAKSALALARGASLRGVMADHSAIVFMSSVAGLRGQSGMSIYSAAKAAIDGMTKSLAVEFAPRGIRVNSIDAGAVETEMHARLIQSLSDDSVGNYREKHLLGFGTALDIAQMAVFLFSDGGRWITGSNVLVDGGFTVR